VLDAIAELTAADPYHGATAAEIAHHMGLTSPRRSAGQWSGPMNPAQRIIGSLTGLRQRGLVRFAARRDGHTGTAYRLTDG
jgi:hypothetical protein